MKTQVMKTFSRLTAVFFLLISSSFAATYYVGSCHASSYATISAAVEAAPAGAIVDVCPGTYSEQVFITRALTLQGITSGNVERATIVVPAFNGGLPGWQFVPDPLGGSVMVAPQIYVNVTAGLVTIKNLTIDASGETTSPACYATGYWRTTAILYENSGGTISGVNTLGQGKYSGCGDGIRDVVTNASPVKLTLTNSSLQDANDSGVTLEGTGLTVDVTRNILELAGDPSGIYSFNASGTISSNFVNSPGFIVEDSGNDGSSSITYSDNVLRGGPTGCEIAMVFLRAAQVIGNKIDGCQYGIDLDATTYAVSLKSNFIANTVFIAIELSCGSNVTLAGNTVTNAAEGVDSKPTSLSLAGITFNNVGTVLNGSCP